MQKLKDSVCPAVRDSLPAKGRPFTRSPSKGDIWGLETFLRVHKSDAEDNRDYLLDSDDRASRLAALGIVALFDVPGVALEVRSTASKSLRTSLKLILVRSNCF